MAVSNFNSFTYGELPHYEKTITTEKGSAIQAGMTKVENVPAVEAKNATFIQSAQDHEYNVVSECEALDFHDLTAWLQGWHNSQAPKMSHEPLSVEESKPPAQSELVFQSGAVIVVSKMDKSASQNMMVETEGETVATMDLRALSEEVLNDEKAEYCV